VLFFAIFNRFMTFILYAAPFRSCWWSRMFLLLCSSSPLVLEIRSQTLNWAALFELNWRCKTIVFLCLSRYSPRGYAVI
jgi:hypothetical protein